MKKFTKRNDWETPPEVFEPLNWVFKFTLDGAAGPLNNKCTAYFDEQENSLMQEWEGVVWINPPYNDIRPWVEKALASCWKGATVVMLLPNSRDTKWFHEVIVPAKIAGYCKTYSYKGRIKFIDPSGEQRTAPKQGNLLVVFTPPMPEGWSLD